MKPVLKIAFTDYWKKDYIDVFFYDLLSEEYSLKISKTPDLLFFSVHGNEHLNYDCLKIFYTGENIKPNYRLCDYSFSFEETDEKNFQLPNFVTQPFFQEFRAQHYGEKVTEWRTHKKEKFCNFIHQNTYAMQRIDFCKKLMEYKFVDCPGTVLNNVDINISGKRGDWMEKFEILKHYKFTIAFENKSSRHYTTEKIYQALLVGSIPIYWGNPYIENYFNPESFINCHSYKNFYEVIKAVKAIDENDSLYRKYKDAAPFLKTSRIQGFSKEEIVERLQMIIHEIGRRKNVSNHYLFGAFSASHKAIKYSRFQVYRPLIHFIRSKIKKTT